MEQWAAAVSDETGAASGSDADGDCDADLPPIAITCSSRDLSQLTMPSAAALASQRAREADCERALRAAAGVGAVAGVARCDSSGSEGEAALSAAVGELRVQLAAPAAGPGPGPGAPPSPGALLDALAQHAPHPAAELLTECARAARHAGPAGADSLADEVLASIEAALCAREGGPWGDAEALGAGAWLCAAAVGAVGAAGRRAGRARRALHALLEHVMTDEQAEALCACAVGAVREPALRLALSDAARGGGGGGGGGGARSRRLGGALVRAALRDLLAPGAGCGRAALELGELAAWVAGGWRALPPRCRYLALQLAARALVLAPAPCAGGNRARLLAALAAPPPQPDVASPDHLKVRVAISKMQLLFR